MDSIAKKAEEEIIKITRYCNILKQASLKDEDYKHCIEKSFAKSMKRNEIIFSNEFIEMLRQELK
ncbi:hypothetical protein ACV3OC_11725 [Clostridium perfringens]